MNKYLKQKFLIFAFMFVLIFIMECVINGIIYKQFFVNYPFLELAMIMIVLAPVFIFKSNKYSIVYTSFILGIFTILLVLNLLLDYASDDIFSLRYIILAGEAGKVVNFQYINFVDILLAIIFVSIYVAYNILVVKYLKKHKERINAPDRYKYYPLGIAYAVMMIALGIVIRMPSLYQIEKDNEDVELYNDKSGNEILNYSSTILKRSSLKNYGLLTYSYSELRALILTNEKKSEMAEEIDNYLNEEDPLNKESEYYGLLKDMNVITIMIETGTDFAISERLTPNLYRLQTEGIYFKENYSKNKTNISELIGICGSTSGTLPNKNYNVTFSLPSILNGLDYSTNYFHCNHGSYYSRKEANKSIGFTNNYFLENYTKEHPELEWHERFEGKYPYETLFYQAIEDDLIPTDGNKFYSFWTTLSTHGPYNYQNALNRFKTEEHNEWYELMAALDEGYEITPYWNKYSNEIKNQIIHFQCEMMELDRAIGMLIDRLEETGLIDNTLLVLYGDHEPYYKTNGGNQLKYYIYDVDEQYYSYQYQTTLIFYNPLLNQKYQELNGNTTYEWFTSPYVIVPTTLDLLGIDYNQQLYVAKSVFQNDIENNNVFYSHEQNVVFSNKYYQSDITSFDYLVDEELDKEELISYSTRMIKRIEIFNNIYSLNYKIK